MFAPPYIFFATPRIDPRKASSANKLKKKADASAFSKPAGPRAAQNARARCDL
jgi:hypothetical protein